jgi:oligosaccharide repeat unit polymerase
MMIILLILFVLLLILGMIVSKNNVFSPSVITPVVWIFCFLLFLMLEHNLPPITKQFFKAISIWVFLLTFFSMLMQSLRVSNKFNYTPSNRMLDIYFWISVCSYPSLLIFAYYAISLGDTGNWAMDLRRAAIGQTQHSTEVYGTLFFALWQVSYLLELFYYSPKNKYRVFILAFFYLSYGVVIMSKIIFLELFLMTICVLYFKKVVTMKHLLIGLGVLFFFFVSFTALRHNTDIAQSSLIRIYILGNMTAFDTLTPESSAHLGENTFRIYYAIANRLGFSNIEPVGAFQPWIYKPIATNTYTGLYPFFKDFGYWGIGIFAIFYGIFYGWLFKKAQSGNAFFILLFSFLMMAVVMQYASELLFAGLSGKIKFTLFLLFPFLAAKYNWFMPSAKKQIS